ncbi:MAG: GNAT family N-acetyltransferase [Terracidiphilus sp.]|nr:GNAT family N-acetyltransferase [Terracidiphilus sp.]
MDELRAEARAEGHNFMERLANEWQSGTNRFDAPGEMLCGYLENGLLVAVGGLNHDPFAGRADVGRIRRVYVRPAWRGKGIGTALVSALINEARQSFACIRLRAENPSAARLYERLGFEPIADADATHILIFDSAAYGIGAEGCRFAAEKQCDDFV